MLNWSPVPLKPQPPSSPLPMAALRRLPSQSVVLRSPVSLQGAWIVDRARSWSAEHSRSHARPEAPGVHNGGPGHNKARPEAYDLAPATLVLDPRRPVAPPVPPRRPLHTRKQFLVVAALLLLAVIGFALTTRTASFRRSVTFSGEVQAAGQLPVNFTTAGRIAEIKVRIGDRVQAGAVLATQERAVAQQALAAAQAALRADEAQLARMASSTSQRTLLELDVQRARAQHLAAQAAAATASTLAAQEAARQRVAASALALDLATRKLEEERRGGDRIRRSAIEAAIQRDKAAVALAKATLRDKQLLAPVSGVVLDIGATPGVFADSAGVRTYPDADPVTARSRGFSFLPDAPQAEASRPNNGNGFAPLITLGDDSRWRVKAQVPESEIVKLRPGQAVDVTFPALPGTRMPATLTTRGMAPILVGDQVHYPATFELTSAPVDLLPGMTATVHLR
jgi:multidrug efflux pump subunit AcrA (membrane-fusion protein)